MKSTRILVVDDEKGICRNVSKILEKNNYHVTEALSAKEALEKMAKDSFSLLISDIIMPETNGLELLRLIKKQWPLTKVIMMTAYASTDTAMKSIRLGAVGYIPKPFTPDEVRSTVEKALNGELVEAPISDKERTEINIVDLDIPFDRDEVVKIAGEGYVDRLGPSDMPVVEMPSPETLEFYCAVGQKVCDIYKKLGSTCKAGLKNDVCPQAKKAAKTPGSARQKNKFDSKTLIGIDQPFSYDEVVSVTGPEYVRNFHGEGLAFVPYEELKKNAAKMLEKKRQPIDVDMPFEREEVTKYTGEAYADKLGPSDRPAVEMPSPEVLEFYCAVGQKVCDIYKKLGSTCKAGLKNSACPQAKAKKKDTAGREKGIDVRRKIGIEMPFDYEEVIALTGPEYVQCLQADGTSVIPYEQLKSRIMKELAALEPQKMIVHKPSKKAYGEDVLVIDDEPAVNNNIRKILSKKGFKVEQAMTKEEALQKIAEKAYPIVLLDLKMPGVKGLELLKSIREARPETRVIIVTGYASIETAVESARLGAVDYLSKPFTPDELRGKAERAFQMAA